MRLLSLLVLPLLAVAQAPFPIVTATANAAQSSAIAASLTAYIGSIITQPAYTSISDEMYTASASSDVLAAYSAASGNPILLASAFLVATATPAWYTESPSDIQSYVSSVAAAEATIFQKVVSGAERSWVGARVGMVVAATSLVAVMLL